MYIVLYETLWYLYNYILYYYDIIYGPDIRIVCIGVYCIVWLDNSYNDIMDRMDRCIEL